MNELNNVEYKEALRRTVRYFYDLQKLRISFGNRSEDPEDYRVVTDKKTGKEKRVKRKPGKGKGLAALESMLDDFQKKVPKDEMEEDEGKPAPKVLDDLDRLFLRHQAHALQLLETTTLERIESLLDGVPIYEEFLKDIKGCGPTMSGVLLSEITLWRTVDPERLNNTKTRRDFTVHANGKEWPYFEVILVEKEERYNKEKRKKEMVDVERRLVCYEYKLEDGTIEIRQDCCPTASSLWYYAGFGVNTVDGKAVRKRKGEKANWSHFLKTKMAGVLSDCFIRCRSPQRDPYDDYKHRKASIGWGNSNAHRHRAAIRFMMKRFLLELWQRWRTLEGMPTPDPYAEAKLGIKHGDHHPLVRSYQSGSTQPAESTVQASDKVNRRQKSKPEGRRSKGRASSKKTKRKNNHYRQSSSEQV